MRVLIAPDKFKGSLSAAQVCGALAAGLGSLNQRLEIDCCPIADGGEGTLDAAVCAGFTRVEADVEGPTGHPVHAGYAHRGDVAIIELAAASGVQHLPAARPAPLSASSTGTGQLMAAALDAGARTLILGVGGSACTDGGAGLLVGLGATLTDRRGQHLPPGGAALRELHQLDTSGLHPGLTEAEIVLACDVDNPLLGATGAAAVYGPQKGASPHHVTILEAGLARWADVVAQATGADRRYTAGAGAAGGVGFAAIAVLAASVGSGIELMLDLTGFSARLPESDLVVTGEGSLDQQTLNGKGPLGVAAAAHRQGIPAVAVAGRITLTDTELRAARFSGAYSLETLEPDPHRSHDHADELLQHLAATELADWLTPSGEAA